MFTNTSLVCLTALGVGCWLGMISAAPIPDGGSENSSPIPKWTPRHYDTQEEHKDYLTKYGHWRGRGISKSKSNDGSEYTEAVKRLQRFAGLNITGFVNNETKKLMQTPRCQLPDDMTPAAGNRTKRYVLYGEWSKKSLTYYFTNYPSNSIGLSPAKVDQIWQRSLLDWSSVAPLVFSKAQNADASDIHVLFATYDHGDEYPFDGPGGVLAHSFFPEDGRLHYDDSESWSDGTQNGINMRQVTTHEFGHILGLAHTSVRSAVMYPYYSSYNPNFHLDPDDIAGIQALYGSVQAPPASDTTTTSVTPNAANPPNPPNPPANPSNPRANPPNPTTFFPFLQTAIPLRPTDFPLPPVQRTTTTTTARPSRWWWSWWWSK